MDGITFLEILAAVSGITCVYLQTKEKIAAWFFGIISVVALGIICWDQNLLSDVILNFIFLILNIYGWWSWTHRKNSLSENAPILFFQKKDWIIWILVIAIVTPIWGFIMGKYLGADLPYPDAFTTVGSLVAQYLIARKFLENWIIWIVVDVVAVNVFLYKELYITAFLFFVYLLLCILGYRDWKKQVGVSEV